MHIIRVSLASVRFLGTYPRNRLRLTEANIESNLSRGGADGKFDFPVVDFWKTKLQISLISIDTFASDIF